MTIIAMILKYICVLKSGIPQIIPVRPLLKPLVTWRSTCRAMQAVCKARVKGLGFSTTSGIPIWKIKVPINSMALWIFQIQSCDVIWYLYIYLYLQQQWSYFKKSLGACACWFGPNHWKSWSQKKVGLNNEEKNWISTCSWNIYPLVI